MEGRRVKGGRREQRGRREEGGRMLRMERAWPVGAMQTSRHWQWYEKAKEEVSGQAGQLDRQSRWKANASG